MYVNQHPKKTIHTYGQKRTNKLIRKNKFDTLLTPVKRQTLESDFTFLPSYWEDKEDFENLDFFYLDLFQTTENRNQGISIEDQNKITNNKLAIPKSTSAKKLPLAESSLTKLKEKSSSYEKDNICKAKSLFTEQDKENLSPIGDNKSLKLKRQYTDLDLCTSLVEPLQDVGTVSDLLTVRSPIKVYKDTVLKRTNSIKFRLL